MYDLSQLTCISGSLHAWGRAAAGILWWFARLRLNVKVQTLGNHHTRYSEGQFTIYFQAWTFQFW